MSFVLPGNARQLRFTGEAKAYVPGEETPGGGSPSIALGKPRVRKATTTPPPAHPSSMTPAPMATSRPRGGNGGPASMTPASPGQRITPVPGGYGNHTASIRQKSHSIDEEMNTMALDREGLDILPGGLNGNAHSPTRPPPPPAMTGRGVAPIPHFRPAQQQQGAAVQTVLVPNGEGKAKGAPLALWVFAAVLAGILSYHVTPAIMSHFEAGSQPAAKITPAI